MPINGTSSPTSMSYFSANPMPMIAPVRSAMNASAWPSGNTSSGYCEKSVRASQPNCAKKFSGFL